MYIRYIYKLSTLWVPVDVKYACIHVVVLKKDFNQNILTETGNCSKYLRVL